MTPEEARIIDEIRFIQHNLDEANDTAIDYMSPLLKELRNYILQVHADYELSLEMILWKDYFGTNKPLEAFSLLFEKMSFYDKQYIVHKQDPKFPHKITIGLNELRNHFAHSKGQLLRDEYNTNQARLGTYELLKQAHDALNDYWLQRTSTIK